MSQLKRQIGSLLVCGFAGAQLPSSIRSHWESGRLGGIILFARNYANREAVAELAFEARSASDGPLLIAVDQEGGRVVRFGGDFPVYPSPAHFGSADDIEGFAAANRVTARELRRVGVNLNLVPVCDLAPVETQHVIHSRSFSSNVEKLSQAVRAQIEAHHEHRVLTCAKHFPGLQSACGDPHFEISHSTRSREEFRELDYAPFRAAIAAGVDTVMVSHLRAPSLDRSEIVTFSSQVVAEELRGYLGFEGIVISDDLLMAGALENLSPAQAGIKALKAGCELLIYGNAGSSPSQLIDEIAAAAERDQQLAAVITNSAARVASFLSQRLSEAPA